MAFSLVAHTFTRKELVEKYGFVCSARAFANARNHAEEHYPGAPVVYNGGRPRISDEVRERVKNFYRENSYLSSSKTIKIREGKDRSTKIIPVRICEYPGMTLFSMFRSQYPDISIKKSSFFELRPPEIKKPKKLTDLCDICVEGKRARCQLSKLLENDDGGESGTARVHELLK